MQKTFYDTEFGDITISFQRNYKNLTLRLSPNEGIRISAPNRASQSHVLAFFESRRPWIRANIEKIKSRLNQKTIFTPETEFKTRNHKLALRKENRPNAHVEITNGVIHVVIPLSNQWEEVTIQEIIRKGITEALRIEAHQYLPRRLFELSTKHEFTVKGLKIKNLRARWGSCTSSLSLNLNLNLMQLPNHLIDHVILHELCHTKFMNHGSDFHNLLQTVDPQAKLHEKEIRKYNPNLY